jgi:phage baseplate assembly protein W
VDRVLQDLHPDPEEAAGGVEEPAVGVELMAATPNTLGQGMSFPPRIGPDGRIAWSAGEDNVRDLIRVILMTETSERLMRETFGCGLRRYLFEPNIVTTRQQIQDGITQAIARWEPRVSVDSVTVTPNADDARRVDIVVQFRLVATQATSSLGLALQLQG